MTITAKATVILYALSLSMPWCSGIEAQAASSTTENQWRPEGDAHVQLPSHFRILSFAGTEQAAAYPFEEWYAAAGLGYQWASIRQPHLENIDPDKEYSFVFGGGYEYLRTEQSGDIKRENRLAAEVTPGFRPLSRLLLRDRNREEFRWINGIYSTTYRNMASAEVDTRVDGVRVTPFTSVEWFYDGAKHSWNEEWYTAGVQLPYKHVFMLETYYRREHCTTCTPRRWNVAGETFHYYFQRPK